MLIDLCYQRYAQKYRASFNTLQKYFRRRSLRLFTFMLTCIEVRAREGDVGSFKFY